MRVYAISRVYLQIYKWLFILLLMIIIKKGFEVIIANSIYDSMTFFYKTSLISIRNIFNIYFLSLGAVLFSFFLSIFLVYAVFIFIDKLDLNNIKKIK